MPVLIIGGPSSVGKTTAASAIAAELRFPVVTVDDLARGSEHPALAFERDESVWVHPPEALCEMLVRKGEALWPEIVHHIDVHADADRSVVIEGEGPSPDAIDGVMRPGISAAFIVERDARRLYRTLHERSNRFRALPQDQKGNVVQMNVLYGGWLIERCEDVGLPWLPSQPWETLVNRLSSALRLPRR